MCCPLTLNRNTYGFSSLDGVELSGTTLPDHPGLDPQKLITKLNVKVGPGAKAGGRLAVAVLQGINGNWVSKLCKHRSVLCMLIFTTEKRCVCVCVVGYSFLLCSLLLIAWRNG